MATNSRSSPPPLALLTRHRHGLLKISPFDSQRQESFYKLLLQFRESRIDPRQDRSLSELREDTLCLSQMLKREGTLFLDLVKQAQNHLCAANMKSGRIEMWIRHDSLQQ